MVSLKQILCVVMLLSMSACTVGPHVDTMQVMVTKYECLDRQGLFRVSRRVALCDTEAECNAICTNGKFEK